MKLGPMVEELRERIGWTRRELASLMDEDGGELFKIESGQLPVDETFANNFQSLTGIDLYIYAWCQNGDISKLPEKQRQVSMDLVEIWRDEIDAKIEQLKHAGTSPGVGRQDLTR